MNASFVYNQSQVKLCVSMALKNQRLISSITGNLAFLSTSTSLENVIGLFDSNRAAQDFYRGLLSLIFDYKNLEDLDKLNKITNYPAIDLGDVKDKIAFQITSDSSSDKIKKAICAFIKHELYSTYDRLIILIIGTKQSYSTNFNTEDKFTFNKETDVWDDNYLIKEIHKLSTQRLEKIEQYLQEELEEYKNPERLFDDDIKQCIEILKRDFGSSEAIEFAIGKRDDTFIERKNEANNVSWEFFKNEIKGHLSYGNIVQNFLESEINRDIRKDYLAVCQSINSYYAGKKHEFGSFAKMFEKVFDKAQVLYKERNLNKRKILILLHNMYFNCDIGEQPK